MTYTLTEIKLPFLRDFVIDSLYREQDGYRSECAYTEINAEEWGAVQAWELYRNGKPDNHFLICYEKYVLEIEVNWELTAEQKQMIFQNICN